MMKRTKVDDDDGDDVDAVGLIRPTDSFCGYWAGRWRRRRAAAAGGWVAEGR